ncbi:MAG: hypothetical protein ACRCWO_13125 [Bosea sp. (in: a-proteobacteria)]
MNLSRRDCLMFGSLAGATALLPGMVHAQGVAIGAIRVDNRQLVAAGGGQPAIEMKALLEAELRRVYAGQLAPTGATLLVTLRSLWLGANGGQRGGRHGDGGSGSSDIMETDTMLVGRRNELIAQTSVLSPVPAGGGMIWSPEIQRLRLQQLAVHNAGWTKRMLRA